MLFDNRALRACLAVTALFVALMASPIAPTAGAHQGDGPDAYCADRLCNSDQPGRKSCWRYAKRESESRCFIRRAARHYGQSRSQAMAIAYRESRYDYKQTNSSSGAAGLYQFMPRTWAHTPYGKRGESAYNPRWAALGAMWMWERGEAYHWGV